MVDADEDIEPHHDRRDEEQPRRGHGKDRREAEHAAPVRVGQDRAAEDQPQRRGHRPEGGDRVPDHVRERDARDIEEKADEHGDDRLAEELFQRLAPVGLLAALPQHHRRAAVKHHADRQREDHIIEGALGAVKLVDHRQADEGEIRKQQREAGGLPQLGLCPARQKRRKAEQQGHAAHGQAQEQRRFQQLVRAVLDAEGIGDHAGQRNRHDEAGQRLVKAVGHHLPPPRGIAHGDEEHQFDGELEYCHSI